MIKTFARTTDGLRDALMTEMEDIRSGIATPNEAMAFAELAEKVIRSMESDLVAERLKDQREEVEHERAERVRKRMVKLNRLASIKQISFDSSQHDMG